MLVQTSTNRKTQAIRPWGDESDKMDEFLFSGHGLSFEGIGGIQNKELLNLYSQVLKNLWVRATVQAADRDSANMYKYKWDKTLLHKRNVARCVMA